MSMQEPLNIDQIEANRKAKTAKLAQYTIGVVSPNGVVAEHYCPPPDDGGEDGPRKGDAVVRWANGAPQVTRRWADRGYIAYQDLARLDGEPEKYDAWKKAVTARIQGYPIRGDVTKLYSKSVLERRAQYKAGSVEAGGKAFDIDAGDLVEDEEVAKSKLLDRLEEVGVAPPAAKKSSRSSKSSSPKE